MARSSRRRHEPSSKRKSPFLVRILRFLVPLATLALLVSAVWLGIRDRSIDLVEAGSPAIEQSSPIAPPPQSVAVDSESKTSSTVTGSTTTVTASGRTSTSTASAPTTSSPQEVVGVAVGRVHTGTQLVETPGGTGPSMPVGSSVALLGEILVVADSTWYSVNHEGNGGWVRADAIEVIGNDFTSRACGEVPTELPPTALAYEPGTADGAADGIAAIEFHESADCNRVVVFLADGLGNNEASFASAFPEGFRVVDVAGRVRIELNETLLVIPELAFTVFAVDEGQALALLALQPDGRSAFNLDMGVARLSVSFLARPARVVLDTVRVSDALPEIGGGVVLSSKGFHDALAAGDGRVVEMTGYARLTSGLGEIAFRRAPNQGATPGSGTPVEVQFGGTSRVSPVFRSWYFYETPRFNGQWAEFRFTMQGLTPGSYELTLGLGVTDTPANIVDPGLYALLVVEAPT